MNPEQLILDLWNTNQARSHLGPFKPAFVRFAGGLETQDYDDLMATIDQNAKKFSKKTIVADGPLVFKPNLQVLKQIKQELPTIADLGKLQTKDLVLFGDERLDRLYLNALNYTFSLAKRSGQLKDRRAEENFICNMIVFSLHYLLNLEYDDQMAAKLIHYGELDQRSLFFLILAHVFGLDVLHFNPKQDESIWNVDLDHLSTRENLKRILPMETFSRRAARGRPISKKKTAAATAASQIEQYLFMDTGVFRPWSFRGRKNEAVLLAGTPVDVSVSWNNEARLREGFEVDQATKTVSVPHFFFEMEGVDQDMKELFNNISQSPNTLVATSLTDYIENHLSKAQKLKLAFRLNSRGLFDKQKLKTLENYPLASISDELEELIVDKLNELIEKAPAIFGRALSKDEKIELAAVILQMDQHLLRLIDNFDYPFQVPKLILFLENERSLEKEEIWLLAYLSLLGFDIALFSPAGHSLLSRSMRNNFFSTFRAEKKDYHTTLNDMRVAEKVPEKSGFGKMLSDFLKNL